jgi:hypothetical protein
MGDEERLDGVIDAALKSYSEVEPVSDLPAIILRKAERQQVAVRDGKLGRKLRWAFAFPAPVAAALILAIVVERRPAAPVSPAMTASVSKDSAGKAAIADVRPDVRPIEHSGMASSTARSRPVVLRSVPRHIPETARQDLLRPAPAPYSAEEIALLNFVQRHPEEAAAAFEAQKHALEPLKEQAIVIAPLEIKPISISEDQENR